MQHNDHVIDYWCLLKKEADERYWKWRKRGNLEQASRAADDRRLAHERARAAIIAQG